jgi:hypothetical protein
MIQSVRLEVCDCDWAPELGLLLVQTLEKSLARLFKCKVHCSNLRIILGRYVAFHG